MAIGKVESMLPSLTKIQRKLNDERAGGQGQHSKKDESEENTIPYTRDEIAPLLDALNAHPYYVDKHLHFELASDEGMIWVKSNDGKMVQTMNFAQVKALHAKLPKKASSGPMGSSGSLLNIKG